ncbi:MAG: hypothetical protein JXA07_13375 [Spirochaetes bacterium]|nr:hypothetical protein [Spirochaetota bacterium]
MRYTGILHYLVMAAALALAPACSGPGGSGGTNETPDIKKGCLSGQCVEGQFETAYQRFAVVTGNVVNLRTRPDLTSRVVDRPAATRKLTVLYVKPEEVTIGGMKGRWAYVRDSVNINLKGWIFDYFLGYVGCFSRPREWNIREIRVILKGKVTVYRCTADGRFTITQDEMIYEKDGASNRPAVTGDILRCKNVIWLKKDRPDDYPVFFHMLENGSLALADQYRDMRGIIMTK